MNPVDQFLSEAQFNHWFPVDFPVFHCRFVRDSYDDALYPQLGIPFSAHLNKAVVKRRAEFLAGRYCAAQVLQSLAIHDFHVQVGKHRNPLWPSGIVGAISHSNSHAVAIAAPAERYLGLGIDIEEVVSEETLENLKSQVLFGEELHWVMADSTQSRLRFSLIFSLKESFFKAAYPSVGRYFDFDALSLDEVDWTGGRMIFSVTADLCASLPRGMRASARFYRLSPTSVVTLVVLPASASFV